MEDQITLGPTQEISQHMHATKYRGVGETFKEAMTRVANALKDNEEHFTQFRDTLLHQRFLPAGRVQSGVGSPRQVTAMNCYVSDTIPDDMDGIMEAAKRAAKTMRLGGGIGYDFSTIRPSGSLITTLDTTASGPVSFMNIFNAVCGTVRSAGHRRGAQMGVLRVDHPDIEEFIEAKTNQHALTNFNISVAVTDEFMEAVKKDRLFVLKWGGKPYHYIRAVSLWEKILRHTWEWAEPGILFIDRINRKNNLHYCETIAASNPCAEQPLPPNGACLLGSFNLVKYVKQTGNRWEFDYEAFKHDIPVVVRAMDNVVDRTIYPHPEQEQEAKNKRRMGLGVTGVANAIERIGYPYGSGPFIGELSQILMTLRDTAYSTSCSLALEKGKFPAFSEKLLDSEFARTLPNYIRNDIRKYGLRNSHLLSIAPTGTISLCADNVSSGIEPVFSYGYIRTINLPDGIRTVEISDYGVRQWGLFGKTSKDVSIDEHIDVLNCASYYVDSACSKTCNVPSSLPWEMFKEVYMKAYEGGASGCATYTNGGKRGAILEELPAEEEGIIGEVNDEGAACYYDAATGIRTCDQ